MGRPKALLPFDDKPLIAHLVQRLSQRFSDIVVVAAPDQTLPSLPVTLVHDAVAYQGPVGGICYGLQAIRGTAAFITSCDVPFLQLSFIDYLVSQLDRNGRDYDVVVPFWQDRLQPLHAVYRKARRPSFTRTARHPTPPPSLFVRQRANPKSAAGGDQNALTPRG